MWLFCRNRYGIAVGQEPCSSGEGDTVGSPGDSPLRCGSATIPLEGEAPAEPIER